MKHKTNGRFSFLALISGIMMALSALGCSAGGNGSAGGGRRPKGSGDAPAAVHVETAKLQRIAVQRQVDIAGTLVSPDQAQVSSEVAGRVREILFELGQEVAPGQVLVKIDPRELEIALRRAESLLRQTEVQLGMDGTVVKDPPPDEQISLVRTAMANRDDARAQFERATQLLKRGLLPQADYDTAQTRVKVTEAAYQAALENVQGLKATLQERRAALELAQKKVDDAVIRAPVAGSVSERLVHVGEFIRENTPVVTIVQVNPLKLRTAIQERYAGLLRPGLPVRFRVESVPNATFDGRLAYISPSVEQTTRTFAIEIMVQNPKRLLKPGFFAQGVVLTQRDENVLAAPEAAVSTLAGVSAVFVIGEDNTVRQQPVTLGAREGDLIEIVSGLEGSEILAATNLNQLATGTIVAIEASDSADLPNGSAGMEHQGKRQGAEK